MVNQTLIVLWVYSWVFYVFEAPLQSRCVLELKWLISKNKSKFTFSTKVFNCICLSSCFLLRSNYLCSWRRFFLYSESSSVFWLALSSFNSLSNLSFSSLYSACESKVLTEWRIKGGNSPSNDFCYFFYGCFY